MATISNLLVSLTLLWVVMTFTLSGVESCQYMGTFICLPNQNGCRQRGGVCTVQGRNCICMSRSSYHSYLPGPGQPGRGAAAAAPPPPPRNPSPAGEVNLEQQFETMLRLKQLMNVIH